MSFLSGAKLETALKAALGTSFKKERIKQAAYELSLGNQVYRTDSINKKREILDEKDSQIIINPGQFALLITEETIEISDKYLAFISIKFGLKIKGLVNVSGFHVDPGFKGKIIFSVYNAGPSQIMMDKSKPYFLIWFSTLSAAVNYHGVHQGQDEISAELIEQLKGDLASPSSLLSKIDKLENDLNKKAHEINEKKSHITWLFQAIAVILAGLLITTLVKNDKLETGYQYGLQAGELKQQFKKEVKLYIDSLSKAKDSIALLKDTKINPILKLNKKKNL